MSVPLDTLITTGAVVFGSLSTYAGTRYMGRNTNATENRKVKLSEFETFKEAYYEQIAEFKERYATQEAKMNKVERLLRLALKHIRDLRTDMRQHDVIPSHGTPSELESLLWTLTDEDDAEVTASHPGSGE
jgi:hypothetical protein